MSRVDRINLIRCIRRFCPLSKRHAFIFLCFQFLVTVIPVWADDSTVEIDVTLDQILTAWKARQDRLQSFHFRMISNAILSEEEAPPLDCEHDLYVDGERYHYRHYGDFWMRPPGGIPNPPPAELQSRHLVQIFDTERQINYEVNEEGFREHVDYKSVSSTTYESGARELALWPIFHPYRIQQPGFLGVDSSRWTLMEPRGNIDGHECLILQYDETRPELEFEWRRKFFVWVDPSRDFIVVRKQSELDGDSHLDIEYEFDPVYGWVPIRWENLVFVDRQELPVEPGNSRTLHSTAIWEVVEREFNQPIDEEMFTFNPPLGTTGNDRPSTGQHPMSLQPQSHAWKMIAAAAVLALFGAWLFARRTLRSE